MYSQWSRNILLQEEPELLASSPALSGPTNCFQSCTLCANGKVALAMRENRDIEMYTLPPSLDMPSAEAVSTELVPCRQFPQSANVLGTLWYPTAVPEDPSSFCFLASVRECPVKLLDASDGRLRASYSIVDHRERQVAPHSMAFNSTISKIYCGFQDAIEVFDINYPGEGERIFTTPSKKSRTGLKGIISSLAFCPDFSGLYAAGTFSSSLVLMDESNNGEIVHWLDGIEGPVTQVKFNPMAPHLMYASSRQSNHILCWDIRGSTASPIKTYTRPGLTSQRISFDIDVFGGLLVTGDKDGFISCYDLNKEDGQDPILRFKGHNDAVAATAFHPLGPNLVSVSGSRHFDNDDSGDTSSSSSDSSSDEVVKRSRSRYPISQDMSMKLWKLPIQATSDDFIELESDIQVTGT